MEELKALIKDILARYEQQKSENARLSSRLTKTVAELESARKRIEILEQKISTLQLTDAFTNPALGKDAKNRVHKLIKEIDECIELLG